MCNSSDHCGNESVYWLPLLVITEYWSRKDHSCLFFFLSLSPIFLFFFCQFIKYATKYIGSFIYLFFYWTRFTIFALLTNYYHVPLIIIYLLWTFTMKIWLEIATVASPNFWVYIMSIMSIITIHASCAVEGLYALSLTMTSISDCKWF